MFFFDLEENVEKDAIEKKENPYMEQILNEWFLIESVIWKIWCAIKIQKQIYIYCFEI